MLLLLLVLSVLLSISALLSVVGVASLLLLLLPLAVVRVTALLLLVAAILATILLVVSSVLLVLPVALLVLVVGLSRDERRCAGCKRGRAGHKSLGLVVEVDAARLLCEPLLLFLPVLSHDVCVCGVAVRSSGDFDFGDMCGFEQCGVRLYSRCRP